MSKRYVVKFYGCDDCIIACALTNAICGDPTFDSKREAETFISNTVDKQAAIHGCGGYGRVEESNK